MGAVEDKGLLRIDFLFRHLGRFADHWAKFKGRPGGEWVANAAADQTAKGLGATVAVLG